MRTRQATALDMLNTIKQRCFMLSDPCHVEKDNAACLFSPRNASGCLLQRAEEIPLLESRGLSPLPFIRPAV